MDRKSYGQKQAVKNNTNQIASPSGWAKDEVEKALLAGFVPEYLTNYRENITRRDGYAYDEFSDMVISKTGGVKFDDTDDPDILLAARIGIVEGVGDGKFLPDKDITREQAATMLYRTYIIESPMTTGTKYNRTDSYKRNRTNRGWCS